MAGGSGILRRAGGLGGGGFSLPEMLIGLVVIGVSTAFGAHGLGQYREATATTRAAKAIRADMAMARSYAIRVRGPVSLVSRDSAMTYVIRDTTGAIFHRRAFNSGAQIALTSLDVASTGDSLTFDSRGILITTGTTRIDVGRGGRTRSIIFNAMGRAQIN